MAKTPEKRTRPALNDFGKAVHHHLIDSGKTMAELEKSVGSSANSFRSAMHGESKPPVGWVTNKKVPDFMRVAAAEAHKVEITANYEAMSGLLHREDAAIGSDIKLVGPGTAVSGGE